MSVRNVFNILFNTCSVFKHTHSEGEGGGEEGEGGEEISQTSSQSLEEEEEEVSEGWDRTVHTHLMALAASPVETLWPKDSLFR